MSDQPRPERPIRRFDVFAECSRLRALDEGQAEDEAKGYGLWLAKVVAARRGGRSRADGGAGPPAEGGEGEAKRPAERFRSLEGEPQTDAAFEREIVERMGAAFYREVFAPAVAQRLERGERYEQFRDSIRADWRPAPR